MKKFSRNLAYVALLIPCLVLSAAVWSWFAPDRIYHCSDDMGSIPLTGILLVFTRPLMAFFYVFYASPPFVHAGAKMGNNDFDHYIWPAPVVWLIWLGFVALAFVPPALVIRLVSQFLKRRRAQSMAA